MVTFADGAAVSLGVGYARPPKYPTHGRLVRTEVLGEKGVLFLDEDHKENILYTEEGFPHAYVPGHGLEMVFLTSNASGNMALGDYWGPLGDETRSWIDHLATGRPCPHATAEQARQTLEVTSAIDRSARNRGSRFASPRGGDLGPGGRRTTGKYEACRYGGRAPSG
ncbi:MAG TPA: hypothetical protein DDZ83_02675 [Nitrospinae bacterium]|nr:hypothetical protein [Nitrospinota bacterium]